MPLAIITGASSGIGRGFAIQLRERGYDELWLVARRRERLEELASELGCKCEIIVADLSENAGVEKVGELLNIRRPEVDMLVSAAGFGDFGAQDELTDEEAARVIDVNAKALVRITNMTVPYMKRGGRIIELASASAFTPLPYFAVYAASKAFVLHYSKALYYELRPKGISVTAVCPGWVKTEFIDKATDSEGKTRPRRTALKPLLDCQAVVRRSLKAAEKRKKLLVIGKFYKMQHLLYKILPDGILSRGWLLMFDKSVLKKRLDSGKDSENDG